MPIADLDTDQRHAASAAGAEIAVSAGAGSGKTRLLVARYLRLIHQDGVPMNAIAAITFTNKAANQMKDRIAQRARELADSDPANRETWRMVAHNAHRATVSTIHAFCSSILRRFPVEANIDPSFTVIDTVTDTALRREAVNDLTARRLAEGGGDIGFLLAVFGMPRLSGLLYELLGMRTRAVRFIDMASHDGGLGEAAFAKRYDRHLRIELDSMIGRLDNFHALRPGDDTLTPVYDAVLAALRQVRDAIGSGETVDCGLIAAAARSISLRGGSAAKWGKETLADLKSALGGCRDFLGLVESYYRLDRTVSPRAAGLLMNACLDAEELHRLRKRERGVLDNDDLLIETWRLLRARPDVCRRVSGSFRHILVDEFQDTDGLQMDILNMIAGNSAASLFTVGDPKQSIYRFRGADVTVFNRFISGINTTFVPLTTNYRSAPAVMAFVNAVFERLMGDEAAQPHDAVYRPMKTNRRESPFSPAVEITVVAGSSGERRRRREAGLIANRIRSLAADGSDWSSMAILFRTGTPLRVFEEVLLASGIPFVNRVGGKLAGSPEAYDIGNLLGWLDDPGNPGLLVSVLLSPFFGCGADDLYALRCAAPSVGDMPGAFLGLAEESSGDPALVPLVPAARILASLATAADRLGVRELLDRAFELTGYTLTLLADPVEGDRSLAAVDLIVETAARFERDGGTKRAFAALLRGGMPFTDETAQVETAGNAVSIMTVHGAKGLEFDVVFLADITGAGNRGQGLVFDEHLGPGFVVRDDRGGARETFARERILEIEKLKEEAESKRLLYVAATRAKNLLCISGGPPAKTGDNGAGNWMTWLHHMLDLPRDGGDGGMVTDLYRYSWNEDGGPVTTSTAGARARDIAGACDDPAPAGSPAPEASAALTAPCITLPSGPPPESASVSKLLDILIPHRPEPRRTRPPGSWADMSSAGAAYGELVHQVLERIDFGRPEEWRDTARAVVAGSRDGAMFAETLANDLARFAGSPLARDIAGADRIRREEPFALMIGGTLVRGAIDLIAEYGDGAVIVDYKTGIMPDEDEPLMHRYRLQLAIYALAVSRAANTMPRSLALAFLSAGEVYRIPCTGTLLGETARRLGQALADTRNHATPVT